MTVMRKDMYGIYGFVLNGILFYIVSYNQNTKSLKLRSEIGTTIWDSFKALENIFTDLDVKNQIGRVNRVRITFNEIEVIITPKSTAQQLLTQYNLKLSKKIERV